MSIENLQRTKWEAFDADSQDAIALSCPRCGCARVPTVRGWVEYSCGASAGVGFTGSDACYRLAFPRNKARIAELEAENKNLRDRFSDADTERNAAQAALKAAFARVAEMEARCKRLEQAGDAMASRIPDDHWEARDQAKWKQAKEARP